MSVAGPAGLEIAPLGRRSVARTIDTACSWSRRCSPVRGSADCTSRTAVIQKAAQAAASELSRARRASGPKGALRSAAPSLSQGGAERGAWVPRGRHRGSEARDVRGGQAIPPPALEFVRPGVGRAGPAVLAGAVVCAEPDRPGSDRRHRHRPGLRCVGALGSASWFAGPAGSQRRRRTAWCPGADAGIRWTTITVASTIAHSHISPRNTC